MTVWWSRGYGGYYLPVGSHEVKPDGIDLLKQMGVLFKAASFKEIRVAGHADKASGKDHSDGYFEKLALSKARATQTVHVLQEKWSGFAELYH